MGKYEKNSEDVGYCLVSLSAHDSDPKIFSDFTEDSISFEDDCALVVQDAAGNQHIVPRAVRKELSIRIEDARILIESSVPLHRLWVCAQGSSVYYKVPDTLPREGNWVVMAFSGKYAARKVDFCADPYFESVYRIPSTFAKKDNKGSDTPEKRVE